MRWDLGSARKAAKKYKTRGEFARGAAGAYHWASRNGVLDEVCEHMR